MTITLSDYDGDLKKLIREFFIRDICYVKDLKTWSDRHGVGLSEPAQPVKIFARSTGDLVLFVQSDVEEEEFNNNIKALGVRWALKSVASSGADVLNNTKKKLVYCVLKEYARTLRGVGGDELVEDEWSLKEMEKLGFFDE